MVSFSVVYLVFVELISVVAKVNDVVVVILAVVVTAVVIIIIFLVLVARMVVVVTIVVVALIRFFTVTWYWQLDQRTFVPFSQADSADIEDDKTTSFFKGKV